MNQQNTESLNKVLPFTLAELTTKEDYKIPVYPDNQHWLAAMREKKSQHPEDSSPAEKMMSALVEIEEGNWGFTLPKKCCLFVAERQLIKKQASARDKAIAKYFRLVQKISKKLRMSQQKVQKMVSRTFENLDTLDPWLEEITAATAELEATEISVATVTVMIQQRLTSNWTEFDTLSLPEALFNIFLGYSENEERAWKVEEVEADLEVSEVEAEEIEATEVEEIEGNEPKQIAASTTT